MALYSAGSLRFLFLVPFLVAGLLASVRIAVHGFRVAHFCEPITQPICIGSSVVHRFTKTPIVISTGPDPGDDDGFTVYQTQAEAVAEIRKYQPLLDGARGCREYLRPLLCSVYLPSCTVSTEPIPPCRDLCEKARRDCRRSMRHLGLAWTRMLNCEQFPTPVENPSCLSALRFGEVNITLSDAAPVVSVPCLSDLSPSLHLQWLMPGGTPASEDLTQPVYFERTNKHTATLTIDEFIDSKHSGNYTCITRDQEFRRSISLGNIFEPVIGPSCEIITVPYCVGQLTYTRTSLPNSIYHSSQSEVENFIKNVLEPGSCSPHLTTLLCSFLLPKCDGNEIFHDVLPCREVCDKVFTDCENFFVSEEIKGLPPPCETFVYSGQGQDCYNGVDFGPVHFPDGWTYQSISLELECRTKPSSIEMANITIPSGASYGLSHLPIADDIYAFKVTREDDRTVKFTTRQFYMFYYSGTYTCNDGVFSRSLMVEDVPTACIPITIPQCIGHLSYSMTQVPNVYGTRTQEEMEQQLGQFGRLIQSGCSPFTNTLICSPLLTRCGTQSDAPLVVFCREMCDKVKNDCRPTLDFLGLNEFVCDMFPYQRDEDCYNGVEIGPVQVSETTRGSRVEVECGYPATRPAKWQGPRGVPIVSSERIDVEMLDSYTSRLSIDGFQDEDGGVYTCSDGTFAQTVNITNMIVSQGGSRNLQLTTTTLSGDDNMVEVTLECTSLMPQRAKNLSWVLPNGFELQEGIGINNVRADYMDSDVAHLIIEGFNDLENSGKYTCNLSGHSVSTTVDNIYSPHTTAITATCEQIQDNNCRHHLGYKMTSSDRYPISSQADVLQTIISFFDDNLDRRCSPYLQTLVCAYKFPECIEGAVDEPQLPCRELCKIVAADCSDVLAELNTQLSCDSLLSQSDGNCFNGIFISPVEYQSFQLLGLTTVEVNCTFLPSVNKIPKWRIPDGTLLAPGQFTRSFAIGTESLDSKSTKLIISRFQADLDKGEYACIVDGLEKSVSISDDELTKGSCQRITEGLCSEGVGYTHAYLPNLLGHKTVAEVLDVFNLYSSLDPDVLMCSPYTRPLLCTLYFPPCDPDAEVPTLLHSSACKELCEKNALGCQQQSQYEAEDCVDIDAGPLPCYDVDEVSISSEESSRGPSSYFLDCTYILLPKYQPVWLRPNGEPVESTDPTSRLRVVQQSPTVTRLHIDDFTDRLDGGTYTCLGRNSSKTILLGDGAVATELEVVIGPVMERGTAFPSRLSVDCVYNLSPSLPPTWQAPNGKAIPYDPSQNVHAISVSDTVTRLVIKYHIASLTTGTYTCMGSRYSATVEL